MNKLIILLFLAFIPKIIFPQSYEYIPIPNSGAIWSEIYHDHHYENDELEIIAYERFSINGEDTVINEIEYKKLYLFYDSIFNKNNATYIGAIRENDQKQVFYIADTIIHNIKPIYTKNEEILLYDFNVEVGDTIKEINGVDQDFIIVENIDTVSIGGKLRKEIRFQDSFTWIEGIGNTYGLLFGSNSIALLLTTVIEGDIICLKHNNETIYSNPNYANCFPDITSTNNVQLNPEKLSVSHLKDRQVIQFKLANTQISNVHIFDIKGNLIDQIYNINQSNYDLETINYEQGLYFYKVTSARNYNHSGKLLIQKHP